MSERTIADDLVDWLVYAPIGAVVTITEDLPGLVAKGRRRMRVVRFAGNIALKVARYRLDSYLDNLRPREPRQGADESSKVGRELEASTTAPAARGAAARSDGPGGEAASTSASASTASTATNGAGPHESARPASAGRRSGTKTSAGKSARTGGRPRGKKEEVLAIPGYDTLAAAQIVKLLPGLSAAELETVRRHELAGRSRATILNRIAQLTDTHPPRNARR